MGPLLTRAHLGEVSPPTASTKCMIAPEEVSIIGPAVSPASCAPSIRRSRFCPQRASCQITRAVRTALSFINSHEVVEISGSLYTFVTVSNRDKSGCTKYVERGGGAEDGWSRCVISFKGPCESRNWVLSPGQFRPKPEKRLHRSHIGVRVSNTGVNMILSTKAVSGQRINMILSILLSKGWAQP
jgi:hypothetical protein